MRPDTRYGQFSGIRVAFSCKRERRIRVLAEGHELFFALMLVCSTPQLSTRRSDPEIEAPAVARAIETLPARQTGKNGLYFKIY
jgi:hypothetical protein